jgi:LacI family transcriptional regulator
MAVTIRDVARLANASPAAVSATLNGSRTKGIRVGDTTRQRIREAAAQIGYVPHAVAKSLATGRSQVIGLMLPYTDAFFDKNPFCQEAMNGILREVVAAHYNAMLYTAVEESGDPNSTSSRISEVDSRVDGMVLVMPPRQGEIIRRCETIGMPFVSLLRPFQDGGLTVNADDYRGGCLAAEHLLSLGHRRIVHLSGNEDAVTTAPREQGYRDTMTAAGCEPWVINAGFDWTGGQAVMDQLLDLPHSQRPTAVFAANDLCAEGAMRAIKARGLRIPDDIAIVGFDDTWFATMTQPALTTVRMPIPEMGALAARMLIDLLDGKTDFPEQVVLPVSLTVRQSCGANAAPAAPLPFNEEKS